MKSGNNLVNRIVFTSRGGVRKVDDGKKKKQAEAEVVPSSSLVQFKIESDLVCLRIVKFNLD